MPERTTPRVFVDTSAFIALARLDDAHHAEAMRILGTLTQRRARLYTTNFVIGETHAMLLRYLGYAAARRFLEGMDRSESTVIVRADESDEMAARTIIYRYEDKDFSLVDAISFTVMERLRIVGAFAFDRHFSQYGAKVLAHPI